MMMRRRMRRMLTWSASELGLTWVVLLLVVSLLGLAWAHRHSTAGDRAQQGASRLAAVLAHDTARKMEQLELLLQTAGGGRQSPASPELSPQERNALLSERVPRDPSIDFVEILGTDGGVMASTRVGQEIHNWSNRDYFLAQRYNVSAGAFIGRPINASREDRAAVPISQRIVGPDGRFAGVAVVALRLSYFRDLFASLALGPGDWATLLRSDGVVLTTTPFELDAIGRSVGPEAPFRAFARSGSALGTVAASGSRDEVSLAFQRVAAQPLVVSVGLAAGGPGIWWFAAVGVALVLLTGLLTHRVWVVSRERDRAERESREKSNFLTTLSHELRSPLHGILGHAEQLSRSPGLGPDGARQVSQIVHAGKHMRNVVNVVLDYARIEARGPALHMRSIDVGTLCEDCMAVVEPAARARGLETRIVFATGTSERFVSDEMQLQQVLINLLSNAVKYTPSGAVELHVKGGPDRLTLEVSDTGIGIPEGRRHQLFKEYERFGTERTSIEGTGLGLAIAYRLVRRLGGHMGHRNAPGGGSVFWVELPAGVTEEHAAAGPVSGKPRQQLRVLVADDSEVNRDVAAAFLRNVGHTVVEAHDGAEAVQLAAAQDFDVVLMDMRMAGVDGLEATRRIRLIDGPRGGVPIVAVTANALDRHAEECRRAGMSDYLAKPFTQAELLAVLARAAAAKPPHAGDLGVSAERHRIDELGIAMDPDEMRRLLDVLALRIEGLLRHLEEPASSTDSARIADLAHELVGCGTLGFARLASAAARFERALATGDADYAEMRDEASAVLAKLRRHRSMASMLAD